MEASELLSDTFDILSSKEIKLLAMRAQACKDLLEEDDMALANVVMQEAQMKIISQVLKSWNFPYQCLYCAHLLVTVLKSLPLAPASPVSPNVCLLASLGVPWCFTFAVISSYLVSIAGNGTIIYQMYVHLKVPFR